MLAFRENHQQAAVTNVIIHASTNHLSKDHPCDHSVKIPGIIESAECAHAQCKILKPCFEGVFTSCTAKSQLLYVQLLRNSVKEGKEMENDFLNTTKPNVNLKNYTNINLFYNYERKYSISFTESQQEIMF